MGTFFINVRFSVAEFVTAQLEKSAESVVLSPALLDIPREHTKEHDKDKRQRDRKIDKTEPPLIDEERQNGKYDYEDGIDDKQYLVKRIGAIASVHEPV